jgi:uncharacterized membrane protein YhaH (DUF805 family)
VIGTFIAAQPLGFEEVYGGKVGVDPRFEAWYGMILLIPGEYLFMEPNLLIDNAIRAPLWFTLTFGLLSLAVILCVRRLHDIGRSGWYIIIWILLLISFWYIVWTVYIFTPLVLLIIEFFSPLILALIPGQQKPIKTENH